MYFAFFFIFVFSLWISQTNHFISEPSVGYYTHKNGYCWPKADQLTIGGGMSHPVEISISTDAPFDQALILVETCSWGQLYNMSHPCVLQRMMPSVTMRSMVVNFVGMISNMISNIVKISSQGFIDDIFDMILCSSKFTETNWYIVPSCWEVGDAIGRVTVALVCISLVEEDKTIIMAMFDLFNDPRVGLSEGYIKRAKNRLLTNKAMHAYNGNMMNQVSNIINTTATSTEEARGMLADRQRNLANANVTGAIINNSSVFDREIDSNNRTAQALITDSDVSLGSSGLCPQLENTVHPHYGYRLFSVRDILSATNIGESIENGKVFSMASMPVDFASWLLPLRASVNLGELNFSVQRVESSVDTKTRVQHSVSFQTLTYTHIDIGHHELPYPSFPMPQLLPQVGEMFSKAALEGWSANSATWLGTYRAINRMNVAHKMARLKHMTGGCLRSFMLKIALDYQTALTIQANGGQGEFAFANAPVPRLAPQVCLGVDNSNEDVVLQPVWEDVCNGDVLLFSLPEGFQDQNTVGMINRYCSAYPRYVATRNTHGQANFGWCPIANCWRIGAEGAGVIHMTGYRNSVPVNGVGAINGYVAPEIIREFLNNVLIITGAYEDFAWAVSMAQLMSVGFTNTTFSRENGGDSVAVGGRNGQGAAHMILPMFTNYVRDLPRASTAYAYFNCYRLNYETPASVLEYINVNPQYNFAATCYHSLSVAIARQTAFHALGLTGEVHRSMAAVDKINNAKYLHRINVTTDSGHESLSVLNNVTECAMHKMFGFNLPVNVISYFDYNRSLNVNVGIWNYVRSYQTPTPISVSTIASVVMWMPIAWDIPHDGSVIRRPISHPWLNDQAVRPKSKYGLPITGQSDESRPYVPDEDLMRNINIIACRFRHVSIPGNQAMYRVLRVWFWSSRPVWEMYGGGRVPHVQTALTWDSRCDMICAGSYSNTWLGEYAADRCGIAIRAAFVDEDNKLAFCSIMRQTVPNYDHIVMLPDVMHRRELRLPNEPVYPRVEITWPNVPLSSPTPRVAMRGARTAYMPRVRYVAPPTLVLDNVPVVPLVPINQQQEISNADAGIRQQQAASAQPTAPAANVIPAVINAGAPGGFDRVSAELTTLNANIMQMMALIQTSLATNGQNLQRAVVAEAFDPPARERVDVTVELGQNNNQDNRQRTGRSTNRNQPNQSNRMPIASHSTGGRGSARFQSPRGLGRNPGVRSDQRSSSPPRVDPVVERRAAMDIRQRSSSPGARSSLNS